MHYWVGILGYHVDVEYQYQMVVVVEEVVGASIELLVILHFLF